MKNILVAFGTRPEAIKLAPVIHCLRRKAPQLRTSVCVTAQHREMLDQVLTLFTITPDYDLEIMQADQDLFDITSAALGRLREVMQAEAPDLVLVQGDTTTAFVAALAASYLRIPVGHIEAGLRSGDRGNPFPEELNRRMIDQLATLFFAPTPLTRQNLVDEGVRTEAVFVTGNTGIDALLMTVDREYRFHHEALSCLDFTRAKVLLVTAHRRESFGRPLEGICEAVRRLADARPDVEIVYAVHPNPNVQRPVRERLGGRPRIHLVEPLDYQAFVQLMDRCYLILTDSGGIQEEAPSLGKPVLVLRDTTERPEAIEAGAAVLVGTDPDRIVTEVTRLLDDRRAYERWAVPRHLFGDGHAADRIAEVVAASLGHAGGAAAGVTSPAMSEQQKPRGRAASAT